ncbi:MAG: vitamin K epoxide reductase family protein [Nibricoccus sp.]
MPSRLKNQLASACYTLGLALAVYLSLLKLFALPCIGPGSCQAVLYSQYGSVFHVPVGIFGALLWIGAIFVPNKDKRDVLLLMLAGGSALFMAIQFFVLRGFCLYCTLHAAAAWGALVLHHERPRFWLAVLALALAGGGFFMARTKANSDAQALHANPSQLITLADHASALPWLGTIHPRSPALVISLDCAACLDLLDQLTRTDYKRKTLGPALFFKITEANRALTTEFVAAVLSQGQLPRRDAFLATATMLLLNKEVALSNPTAAAVQLAATFREGRTKAGDAEKILQAQAKTLATAKLNETTPLLISRDGGVKAVFGSAELFP